MHRSCARKTALKQHKQKIIWEGEHEERREDTYGCMVVVVSSSDERWRPPKAFSFVLLNQVGVHLGDKLKQQQPWVRRRRSPQHHHQRQPRRRQRVLILSFVAAVAAAIVVVASGAAYISPSRESLLPIKDVLYFLFYFHFFLLSFHYPFALFRCCFKF